MDTEIFTGEVIWYMKFASNYIKEVNKGIGETKLALIDHC